MADVLTTCRFCKTATAIAQYDVKLVGTGGNAPTYLPSRAQHLNRLPLTPGGTIRADEIDPDDLTRLVAAGTLTKSVA